MLFNVACVLSDNSRNAGLLLKPHCIGFFINEEEMNCSHPKTVFRWYTSVVNGYEDIF